MRPSTRVRAGLAVAMLGAFLTLSPVVGRAQPGAEPTAAPSVPVPGDWTFGGPPPWAPLGPGGSEAAPDAVAVAPRLWFSPLPSRGPGFGSQDYMALFNRRASWTKAAKAIAVFKLEQQWVLDAASADLQTLVKDLTRRRIPIAIETGPLSNQEGCGWLVNGFLPDPVARTVGAIDRVVSFGGTVSQIAFNEPVSFGTSTYGGPSACNWTVDQVADRVSVYLDGVMAAYPKLKYGDIESDHADVDLVAEFIEGMAARGYPLSFLHWDVDWDGHVHWVEEAAAMAARTRALGPRFGMIYYGRTGAATDAAWLTTARQNMAMFETLTGIRPDDVIFQSWHALPNYVLPELNVAKFANLVTRYADKRTHFTLTAAVQSDGSVQASGALLRDAGLALRRTAITVVARPLNGEGIVYEYRLTGVVPAGATVGAVGIRINTECSCAAAADLELMEVRFSQGGVPVVITNGSFEDGLDSWGAWGTAPFAASDASDGSGGAIAVHSTSSDFAGLNSTVFAVTAGTAYEVVFRAKVAPASEGSGYFALMFPTANGDHRRIIQLSGVERVVAATTTTRGMYAVRLAATGDATLYRVTAGYAGDGTYWPAYGRVIASVPGAPVQSGAVTDQPPVPGIRIGTPNRAW